jgi:hypothetical protein
MGFNSQSLVQVSNSTSEPSASAKTSLARQPGYRDDALALEDRCLHDVSLVA